jgi:hypothetical protein
MIEKNFIILFKYMLAIIYIMRLLGLDQTHSGALGLLSRYGFISAMKH